MKKVIVTVGTARAPMYYFLALVARELSKLSKEQIDIIDASVIPVESELNIAAVMKKFSNNNQIPNFIGDVRLSKWDRLAVDQRVPVAEILIDELVGIDHPGMSMIVAAAHLKSVNPAEYEFLLKVMQVNPIDTTGTERLVESGFSKMALVEEFVEKFQMESTFTVEAVSFEPSFLQKGFSVGVIDLKKSDIGKNIILDEVLTHLRDVDNESFGILVGNFRQDKTVQVVLQPWAEGFRNSIRQGLLKKGYTLQVAGSPWINVQTTKVLNKEDVLRDIVSILESTEKSFLELKEQEVMA